MDVTYTPTPGATLDYSSIYASAQLTVTPAGGSAYSLKAPTPIEMKTDPNSGAQMATVVPISGATLNADDIAALQNDSVTRFRYDLTNVNDKFAAGDLTVNFAGTWKDSFGNTPGTGSVSVHIAGPTAAVVSPAGGSGIDINTVNGRTYIDVTIPDPPAGFQIDWDAMAQRTPVFTLSGPGVGSAKVDTSQAPLVDSVAKSVRYWITGAFTTVRLSCSPGSPAPRPSSRL